MGFEPIGNGKKLFEEMSDNEKTAYKDRMTDIFVALRTRRSPEKADELEDLGYWLSQACEYGIVFYPNGEPVFAEDIEKMAANPATMLGNVSDLIVVKHDLDSNTNERYSMDLVNRKAALGKHFLANSEILAKEQGFHQKNYNAAQMKSLSKMEKAERRAYVNDVNKLLDKLSADGIELESQTLKECLENAIDKGCVRTLGGVVPAKENVEKFIRTPAFLKILLFTQRAANDLENANTYRLIVSDENPPTVKLDRTNDLSLEDMGQMKKEFDSLDKKEKVPGLYARALAMDDQNQIAKYEKEMREFGFKFTHLEGLNAFRLADEKQVYAYGSYDPCKTPDDLVKAVRRADKPTPPNKWGTFEFLRKGWHKIFKNLPDYQEYDKAYGLYKIDRYNLAKEAGFDVSKLEGSAKEAEEKYGSLYDAYKTNREVDAWVDRISWRAENKTQEEFLKDFKEALKSYPEIGKQIVEESPLVTKEMFGALAAVAQPYMELKQDGYFDKENLGILGALAMAAKPGMFSTEMSEKILGECKALNPEFAPDSTEKALAEVRAKKEAEKLENEKKSDEIKKQTALKRHPEEEKPEVAPKEEKPEVVVVGGGKNGVVDLDDGLDENWDEVAAQENDRKNILDLDDDGREEENLTVEKTQTEPRRMNEEEKKAFVEEVNNLSEGEKRELDRLMVQHGFGKIDDFNLGAAESQNAALEGNVNENTNNEPQMGGV